MFRVGFHVCLVWLCLNAVLLFLFSEKFKQDYEKLEELLKTLPLKTSHEVMVGDLLGCTSTMKWPSLRVMSFVEQI